MIKIEDNMPEELKKVVEYMNKNNINLNTNYDDVDDLPEEYGLDFINSKNSIEKPISSTLTNINFDKVEEEEIDDFL